MKLTNSMHSRKDRRRKHSNPLFALELKVSSGKYVEEIVVELGCHASQVSSFDATGLVVRALLVSKLVEELAVVADAVFSFNGSSVEALVHSKHKKGSGIFNRKHSS